MKKQKKLRNKKYVHEEKTLRERIDAPEKALKKAMAKLEEKSNDTKDEDIHKWHPH